jgi:hypothetical protein
MEEEKKENFEEKKENLEVKKEKKDEIQQFTQDAVFSKSEKIESDICKGYDFNNGLDYDKLLESFLTTGFQATNFAQAVKEVNRMVFTSSNL